MVTITFEAEKQTENTIRYSEVDSDASSELVIGKLYVQKTALKELAGKGGKMPSKLRVTVEVIE